MNSAQVFKYVLITVLGIVCVGNGVEVVIFTEGFNTGFSEPNLYTNVNTYAARFGAVAPNIVPSGDNDQSSTEGDSFCGLNNVKTATGGGVELLGRGSVNLGTVVQAGITYTFTGDFSWRYSEGDLGVGDEGAVKDLHFGGDTGMMIDHVVISGSDYYFTNSISGAWNEFSFSYTTVAGDIGKNIAMSFQLWDDSNFAGLTQLLTDNWKVTTDDSLLPPPQAPIINIEVLPDQTNLVVSWISQGGYHYSVKTSSDLTGSTWVPVQTNMLGTGGSISYTGLTSATESFYQVIAE